MKNILLIFLTVLFISGFYSCNKSEDPVEKPVSEQNRTRENNSDDKRNKETEQNSSGDKGEAENKFRTRSVKVDFPAGSDQITLDGDIYGFGDKISYEFEASKGQTLSASVKPKTGEGNVRINQIHFPDGKADGPFSDKITYNLTESGNWKLIIGEDLMAGEPWEGAYLLTIEIK